MKALILAILLVGCSATLMEQRPSPACQQNTSAPYLDAALAMLATYAAVAIWAGAEEGGEFTASDERHIGAFTGVAAVGYVASSYYGFSARKKCRDSR